MIRIRPAEERGHFDHGWLDTYHTFSFGHYHDPEHMGFRDLRVLNDDTVQPGQGFGTHGHRDMEIISYVVEGALEHKDSMGTGSVLRAGDVQRMSAGTGVTHSEFNHSGSEPLRFLQIWVLPQEQGITPGYEERHVDAEEKRGKLRLIASPAGEGDSLKIHQDIKAFATLLAKGDAAAHTLDMDRHAWVQVVRGTLDLNGHILRQGDGAAVSDSAELQLRGVEDGEALVFDLN